MKLLQKIFRITPFRLSLFITLAFASIALLSDFFPNSIPMISTLDDKGLDLKFRLRGMIPSKSKIIIVAGDEKAFQTFGQWPWDRSSVFAPLFEKLCKYEIKAMGVDFIWSEHERALSGKMRETLSQRFGSPVVQSLVEQSSGDIRFRKAIESCGKKLVLGYAMLQSNSNSNDGLPKEEFDKRFAILTNVAARNTLLSQVKGRAKYAESRGDHTANVALFHHAENGLLNIPEITPNDVGQGFLNNDPDDSDGNYRHSFLFFRSGYYFVSSLALRLAQKVVSPNDTSPHLLVQPQIPERNQVQAMKLDLQTATGPVTVPLELNGQAITNYHGPNKFYANVSIADVLSADDTIEYEQVSSNLSVTRQKQKKSDFFKDAILILGITAVGQYDIRPRPYDSLASGVENHANILDNIINNEFLVRPTEKVLAQILLAIITISIIYGYALTKLNAKLGLLCAVGAMGGLLYFDQVYLFNRGVVFSGHLQAIQFLLQYIGITVLRFIQEEDEKKFIRSAFDKYVSPSIVDSMLKDPSKLRLGGEKKELSVMFSDIRGFTELTEKIDVKSLTLFLNEYLGSMTEILQKNNGTLDKYIGDAVMGFWGAPVDLPNHATLAVRSAVEMLLKLEELNVHFKTKYGLTIDIGLGINSGPVSVGNFGSNKVFEYTVIGDNVNLASRLEGVNKYYGTHIIISEMTFKQLKHGEFLTREVDTVKVKGKQNAVKIYEVFPDSINFAALKSITNTFHEGLSFYYFKKWQEALSSFQSVLSKHPHDKVTLGMIKRCEYFIKNPPAEDWDGSWTMESK